MNNIKWIPYNPKYDIVRPIYHYADSPMIQAEKVSLKNGLFLQEFRFSRSLKPNKPAELNAYSFQGRERDFGIEMHLKLKDHIVFTRQYCNCMNELSTLICIRPKQYLLKVRCSIYQGKN